MYICLYIFLCVEYICGSKNDYLSYLDFECKDNDNMPVDWWYLYKPPANTGPHFNSGSNFTYISSRSSGRWQTSDTTVNYNSMIQYTLSPLLQKMKQNRVAVLAYGDKNVDITEIDLQKSTAYGLIFGNDESGVWFSHTVPDFPDLSEETVLFPEDEISEGHMIICFTVKPPDMDVIATAVGNTSPNIVKFILPEYLVNILPHWKMYEYSGYVPGDKVKIANFDLQAKSLRAVILARVPGDPHCLYTRFARIQGIVLDVYSSELYHVPVVCTKQYSLRHIDTISLKFPEESVYYINNKTDRVSFGVSTAAMWQRRGQNHPQYWTCTGNTDIPGSVAIKGSLIICVNHYEIWLTFDNLKTKEPFC